MRTTIALDDDSCGLRGNIQAWRKNRTHFGRLSERSSSAKERPD